MPEHCSATATAGTNGTTANPEHRSSKVLTVAAGAQGRSRIKHHSLARLGEI